ncbi:MAG: DNA polymerase III subunit beta [Candidatus Cloacimonetes bacterium]|nr:DNA polymerase III subunit beta [Candidatus Cloacimonadota bacterium]
MKFSVEKKDLVANIQSLYNIAPSKNALPILTNYLIEANPDDNSIRFTATDLDITVIARFSLSVSEGGRLAVSAKDFTEIINSMPEAMIHCEKIEDKLHISCGHVDFDLHCADVEQYPLIPEANLENAIEIDARMFRKMVANTHFAASIEANRPIFTGIYWKLSPEYQIMAATDGKKIADFQLNQSHPDLPETEKIIPPKGLIFLRKTVNDENKKIQMRFESNRVLFHYGNFTVFSHVLEGRYPEYRKAMPTENNNILTVDKSLLLDAIRRISILSPDEPFRIKMEINATKLEISSKDRERGEAVEQIDKYEFAGEPTKIAFNYKYLQSILNVIETDKVLFKLSNSQGPALIYNMDLEANYEVTFLLMPLRIT